MITTTRIGNAKISVARRQCAATDARSFTASKCDMTISCPSSSSRNAGVRQTTVHPRNIPHQTRRQEARGRLTVEYQTCRGPARSSQDDLGCVKTLEVIGGGQQRNRACTLGESFMRERRSV